MATGYLIEDRQMGEILEAWIFSRALEVSHSGFRAWKAWARHVELCGMARVYRRFRDDAAFQENAAGMNLPTLPGWAREELVELSGIEPLASSLRTRRSPS